MNKIIKQAFTLIELLVVIAIIGILSGLIVVSMGGVTNKANIAKAQVFSNSLRNSLMLNLVAEYKLDEGIGTAIYDTWGSGAAAWYGSGAGILTPSWKTESECVYNNCLAFDGTDDYVLYNDPLLNATEVTVCVWAKKLAYKQYASFVYDYSTGFVNFLLGYESSDGTIAFYIGDGTVASNLSFSGFTGDVWHYVCGSFIGSGEMAIYMDGIKKNFKNTTIAKIGPTQSSNRGMGKYSSYFFNGLLDDIRFYTKAIASYQIQEQYYAGLNKLLINGGITGEEYLSRVLDLNNSYGKK
jgi:prepilin-type N-terminal cleavage/methylation domain-containing protein